MDYLKAFLVGGAICCIGQILIDKTRITPARILIIFLVSGVILTMLGVYEPIVKFAGAGATVPLTGFGYSLAKGTIEGIEENGLLGVLTGGLTKTAGGVSAAIVFGFLISVIFKPKAK